MIQITPEERAQWKQDAEAYGHTGKDLRIIRLCDTLEAVEARAKQAERERDILIGQMAGFCGVCPVAGQFQANNCPHPLEMCPSLIRDHIAAEAAKAGA